MANHRRRTRLSPVVLQKKDQAVLAAAKDPEMSPLRPKFSERHVSRNFLKSCSKLQGKAGGPLMQRATDPGVPRRYCHKTDSCPDKLIDQGRRQGEYVVICLAAQACSFRGHSPVWRRLPDPGPKNGPGGGSSISPATALPGPFDSPKKPGNSRAPMGRPGSAAYRLQRWKRRTGVK